MKLFHFQFPASHYGGKCCELLSIFIRSDKSPSKEQVVFALKSIFKQGASDYQDNQAKEVIEYLSDMKFPALDGWFTGMSTSVKHPKWGQQTAYLSIVFFWDVHSKSLESEIEGKLVPQSETLVHVEKDQFSEEPFRQKLDLSENA